MKTLKLQYRAVSVHSGKWSKTTKAIITKLLLYISVVCLHYKLQLCTMTLLPNPTVSKGSGENTSLHKWA